MFGDTARGLTIALLAVLLAVLPGVPNAPIAPMPLLLGVGLTLQLGLSGLRWWVRRQERAHGIDGAWSPTMVHIGTLLTDGLTVLLVAIAVFQGMLDRAMSI
ncbi:MAG TPA: hypothetical protein VN581_11820 [Patescibacteria group bacterium]|nr:hypothetical protein [Patescibacteria group bacterium]